MLKSKKKNYLSNNNGNIGMTFAIMLLPLMACLGVAVDYSRLSQAHDQLQSAADSAALSAALAVQRGDRKQMEKTGEETFHSNLILNDSLNVTKVAVGPDSKQVVQVVANAKLEPTFIQIFGYPKLDLAVSAKASTGSRLGAEVAIAIDSTTSMAFDSRWDTAMASVENILEQVKDNTGSSEFFVSLVPFTDRVNIGQARSDFVGGTIPHNWRGCVEPREEVHGGYNWMLSDDSADQKPFVASVPGTKVTMGSNTNYTINCPQTAITGPVKDPETLVKALKSLTPTGTGRVDVGLAWSWRLLSPNWSGSWGAPGYPAPNLKKRKKYLIFITDGNTGAHQFELSAEPGFGSNQGSAVLFEHIQAQCDKIKADGIEIYMLQLDGNDFATPYFEQCATSASHFYRVYTPEDISNAFRDLLIEFKSEVRLLD